MISPMREKVVGHLDFLRELDKNLVVCTGRLVSIKIPDQDSHSATVFPLQFRSLLASSGINISSLIRVFHAGLGKKARYLGFPLPTRPRMWLTCSASQLMHRESEECISRARSVSPSEPIKASIAVSFDNYFDNEYIRGCRETIELNFAITRTWRTVGWLFDIILHIRLKSTLLYLIVVHLTASSLF